MNDFGLLPLYLIRDTREIMYYTFISCSYAEIPRVLDKETHIEGLGHFAAQKINS